MQRELKNWRLNVTRPYDTGYLNAIVPDYIQGDAYMKVASYQPDAQFAFINELDVLVTSLDDIPRPSADFPTES